MLVTVALVTLFSVYALWIAHVDKSWIHALLGVLSLVASYGAATLRSWSQWLVYLLTALFVAAWGYSVYAGAAVELFDIFYSSRTARSQGPRSRNRARTAFLHSELERFQTLS